MIFDVGEGFCAGLETQRRARFFRLADDRQRCLRLAMAVFLGVLVVGFIYEWKKGALEWE